MTPWLARLRRRLTGHDPGPRPHPLATRAPSLAVPFAPAARTGGDARMRCAVSAHLFHADLADEFRRHVAHIPGPADLYVSTDTEAKAAQLDRAFADGGAGRVTIRVAPNVGRDMASKFVTFADVYAPYDAVLFVHSKKSTYLDAGRDWRATLLQTLCGSRETVESILRIFRADDRVGLVFPDHYPGIADRLLWGGNRALAGALAARAGIPLDRARALEFVSGSMFWARPRAVAPLLSLRLGYDDFPPETGQLDATTAHALERLLLYSTEAAGLDWLKVADPRCYPVTARILPIDEAAALPSAIRRSRTRLLEPTR